MFRNYLTVAYRNLVRYKVYSAINITGLAIGIAFCILTFLYIRHEWSFDAFHEKADRIYRVYNRGEVGEGGDASAAMPGPLGPKLAEAFPTQMQHVVRINTTSRTLQYGDHASQERVIYVDPGFWDIFSFPLIKGDPATALNSKDAIIISETAAQKFFGNTDPMGKSFSFTRNSKIHQALITGIAKDIPETSSIQFDCIQSYGNVEDALNSWNYTGNTSTYVLLHDQIRAEDIEKLLPRFINWSWPITGENQELKLQPLADVHFSPEIRAPEPATDPAYSYILLCITALVLFVACVNFMTLALGRSASRAREIGIRKVVGAHKPQVIVQFLTESVLLSLIAFVIGLALSELLMPLFNNLMAQKLSIVAHLDGLAFASLMGLTLIVGLLAGTYPAFVLSGFMPIHVLKGRLKIVSAGLFSQFLVIFQIAMSAVLVISALIMTSQLDYLRTKPLGFDSEHLIAVSRLSKLRGLGPKGIETYRDALLSHHAILGVTQIYHMMRNGYQSRGAVVHEGTTLKGVEIFFVDYDFVPTLDIKLIEGRNYSRDLVTDPAKSVIINQTLAKQLGPGPPLGKTLKFFDDMTVIGVVNDFHFRSLHHKIGPALLKCNPEHQFSRLLVRVRANDIPGTLSFMEAQWEAVTQSSGFRYSFLDEGIDRQYRTEERWHRMIGYGTLFAIFIACLGAFGLTALAVTRRTKEIGIRKILGASVTNVVRLLSREFVLLVGIANVLAWPVAYWAMSKWLSDFAYRIELGIGAFALGGVLTLLVVIGTVSLQAVKAAKMN
ncbi:MAG: ABC transporter permease, partial [Gemmatimonadota bacterium]|nr:ABC transporter permease [Gemmatimonadota bacterium]